MALFGEAVPSQPSALSEYRLECGDGFLFATPHSDSCVEGLVLSLTNDQIALADLWEDVPLYSRIKTVVKSLSGPLEAWVYVRPSAPTGHLPPDPAFVTTFPRPTILRMMRSLHREFYGKDKCLDLSLRKKSELRPPSLDRCAKF